ncbi:unnamed protein product [Rotaria sp. Silwood2]|nr:unnamed protein product [Rotaria sp. Silwood2]CAF2989353.1 unnamed protein product [Rotaria sp. Silwood2]CAF4410811.1 unnamed protein product [Rotaria sp. Silwood2]CAF4446103.1 unnamed protein product [Rotaria sp. Silwood2]CAF4868227.1 unnamed protein product [Rotaria sp. Silwood2]
MLAKHTHKCRHINKMNIQLGNLASPKQLQEKALNNQYVFEQEVPLLSKSLENDSSSKIDALYERQIH